jgi:hypothetical protein
VNVAWHLSIWSVTGVCAWVVAWFVAVQVYRAAPQRSVNRRLAMMLVAEGLAEGTGLGLIYSMPTQEIAYAVMRVCYAAAILLPALYLRLLTTFETPLVRPLRSRLGIGTVIAFTAGLEVLALASPQLFFKDKAVSTWYATWDCLYGPLGPLVFLFNAAASTYGCCVAVSAYLRAPPASTLRTRARWVSIAFGAHDVLFVFCCVVAAIVGSPSMVYNPWDVVPIAGLSLTTLIFIGLLGFGILRSQILDIELRLKRGISRSVLVCVFITVFLVGQKTLESYLSKLHPAFAGIAAGLLALILLPVQRLTDRLADTLMPNVNKSAEYLAFKKLEIYQAAVESAIEERRELPDAAERRLLDRLRNRLGLALEDARAIEGDVFRSLGHLTEAGVAAAAGGG